MANKQAVAQTLQREGDGEWAADYERGQPFGMVNKMVKIAVNTTDQTLFRLNDLRIAIADLPVAVKKKIDGFLLEIQDVRINPQPFAGLDCRAEDLQFFASFGTQPVIHTPETIRKVFGGDDGHFWFRLNL